MKKKINILPQKKSLQELLDQLSKNDWTQYYKVENTFLELFEDNTNPKAFRIFLNRYRNNLVNQISYCLIELRGCEKSQRDFSYWFCYQFYRLTKEWIPYNLGISGIEQLEKIKLACDSFLEKLKLNEDKLIGFQSNIEMEEIYNNPSLDDFSKDFISTFSILGKKEIQKRNINLYYLLGNDIKKKIEILEENILKPDNLDVYYNNANVLRKIGELKNEYSERCGSKIFIPLEKLFGNAASENELLLIDFFWSIIRTVYEHTEDMNLEPCRFYEEFILNKVYLKSKEVEQVQPYSNEIKEIQHFSINQRLLILKILGVYDHAKSDFELNGKNLGILFSAILKTTPGTIASSIPTFEKRLIKKTPQIVDDLKVVEELFIKIGRKDFYRERIEELQLLTIHS